MLYREAKLVLKRFLYILFPVSHLGKKISCFLFKRDELALALLRIKVFLKHKCIQIPRILKA